MKRRTVLLGGLNAGLALAMPWRLAQAQSSTNVKFVVDFTYQGNHAIWGLALAQGLFSHEGLNVTMDRGYGSGDTIVKVASGAYDVGFADVNAAVKFNVQNPDKRVIAVLQVFNRTLSAFITLKKSGITDPQQLPGHTVGAPEADASRLLFPAFAKKNGIDPASITWKSIAPNLREAILIQGQVDAITGFTSSSLFNLIGAGVPREDVVLMPYAKYGLDLYGNAVIIREDMIKAKPDMVRGFVKATIEGTKALIKDPQAGLATMHARDPMFDVALEADRLKLVLDDAILTPEVKKNGFGSVVPERMDLTIKSNLEANGLNADLKPDQLYTTSFFATPSKAHAPSLSYGMASEGFVEIADVSLHFGGAQGTLAVEHLNMFVAAGELTAVVGPSGCGKSSLMKLVAGLVPPTRGAIRVGGVPVKGPLKVVGMAFQNPTLLPWRTTLENLMLPLQIVRPYRSRFKADRPQHEANARRLLERVGLYGFEERFPWQLSGGMQQRASLCRALIHKPSLLMLDEPFAALDAFTREDLWDVLQAMWAAENFTTILVTHDLREAVYLADTVHLMSARPGRIVSSHHIDLPRPRNPETAFLPEFTDLVHTLREQIRKERVAAP